MNLGETYKVKIDNFDINGYGVAHIDGQVVFVEGAMEGETVICKITNPKRKYSFAEAIKILEPSKDRIEPLCPYYEYCGGCDMMHIKYETECMIKELRVKQTLRDFDYKLNPIIKNDKQLAYRNKIMVPFTKDDDGNTLYGFYEKKSHKIVSIDKCLISDDKANEIVAFIARYLSIFNISIYDEINHKGLFRELMIRNTALDEYMVVLIVTADHDFSKLVDYLKDEFPSIKSIYLNINNNTNNVLLSDNFKLIYGKPYVTESILGLKFNVSPSSFMQVNHDQCEKLYSEAIRCANLDSNMNVIDAYCGMGSITLNIAKNVKKVYGIEIVEDAIKNANSNKELNNINNAEFICGKCEDKIKELVNKEKIDVIFFDPPRKGCDIEFLKTVIDMKIPKIVYISCNIATAARDIKILEDAGYKLEEATPVDLFSSTLHVETVCTLSLGVLHK
jgi:23S rRNA (uracil1939-C5)-methyltransferase